MQKKELLPVKYVSFKKGWDRKKYNKSELDNLLWEIRKHFLKQIA